MTNDEQETRAAFAQVFAEFAVDLEQWVQTLEQAAGTVSSSSDQDEIIDALNSLREMAHKVCGSAGSFGYQATSEGASPLEDFCGIHQR